ncbi:MAG: hypothetical protein ABIO06_04120 [Pseudolysinimonas sp.]
MSEAPVDPPVEPASTVPLPAVPAAADKPGGRRLGPLPVWLWLVLALIAGVVLIILGFALLARDGGLPGASGSPSPSESSASPTPSETPSATPTVSPAPSSSADQGTFDSDLPNFLADTLDSQNTAVLAQSGTFSNPVFVLAANSDLTQNMSPEDAVSAMDFMFTPSDPNPWDFALSDSVLAGYRAGPFGQYFPVGAIVARSHDGHVFSFIGHDSTITTMFMAASEDALH